MMTQHFEDEAQQRAGAAAEAPRAAGDRPTKTRTLPESSWAPNLPEGVPPTGRVVVTIARQLGSGGSEVGRLVAQQAGLTYVDRQIITEVARRLGVDVREAQRLDEYTAGIAAQIWEAVRASQPFLLNYASFLGTLTRSGQRNEIAYLHLTQRVIRELAAQGDVVIVGRGSQFLLRDLPRTLHVYIFAPLPQRIAHVMRTLRVDQRRARELIERRDYDYDAYLRRYYGNDGRLPELYHLLINTGLFSFEQAAGFILQALPLVRTST
jgi:cytidylate kinase